MSKEQIRALRSLARNIRKNRPRIEKKLCKAGIKPDPALVYAAAKYYDALDRLAKAKITRLHAFRQIRAVYS